MLRVSTVMIDRLGQATVAIRADRPQPSAARIASSAPYVPPVIGRRIREHRRLRSFFSDFIGVGEDDRARSRGERSRVMNFYPGRAAISTPFSRKSAGDRRASASRPRLARPYGGPFLPKYP